MISEIVNGSQQVEAYNADLIDDPAFNKDSTYVPDDIKRAIKKWSKAMGLSHVKKKNRMH